MSDLFRALPAKAVRAAFFLGFAWCAASAAWSADNDVDVIATVAQSLSSVSLAQPTLPTYASYDVGLRHYQGAIETLDSVSFTATTTVLDSNQVPVPNQAARFVTPAVVLGRSCLVNGTATSLTCTFPGGLNNLSSAIAFTVSVLAPTAGSSIRLTFDSSWLDDDEPNGTGPSLELLTGLLPPDPLNVVSYLPPTGGRLFTGTNNGLPAPTSDSTWATTVVVPGTDKGHSVHINNKIAPLDCPRASNLRDCSSSFISVPGSFGDGLVFTLRRDGSTVAHGPKIKKAIVYYEPDDEFRDPRLLNQYPGFGFQVPSCLDTTYGILPAPGIPCIRSRTAVYAPKVKGGKDDREEGDEDDGNPGGKKKLLYWEFQILARDNGRFTN